MTRTAPSLFRRIRAVVLMLLFLSLCALAALLLVETRTSMFEAPELAHFSSGLSYRVRPGPSAQIRFPDDGPFDLRYGYARLPAFSERMVQRDYTVTRQAVFSDELQDYVDKGFFPPYGEKTQAGLSLADCRRQPLFDALQPRHQYASFDEIPPLVVETLLFIENRDLLDASRPYLNPALDWPRLGRAALAQVEKLVKPGFNAPGGSTLATQMEKFRHAPDGITLTPRDKLLQMGSASVRAYREGALTLPARRRIVLDYVNSVPLAAQSGYGEVNGLGDGLWVWFGTDFAEANQVLAQRGEGPGGVAGQGRMLRQVLALMIAHRRPTHYLGRGRDDLDALVDGHLRLLAGAGVINPVLRDAALEANLAFRDPGVQPVSEAVELDKGTRALRGRLATLLDVPLYDLDRLDLSVRSSLDGKLQSQVGAFLRGLADPAVAANYGLLGERLLQADQTRDVRYSFTLLEAGTDGNRVRVQTDTDPGLFDINEGSKLELGSTAKLRVLATYLGIIADLHERYSGVDDASLSGVLNKRTDPLTRWVVETLRARSEVSLEALLQEALERRYSASPAEVFFTGGGAHTFHNFNKEDDGRSPTVREALRASINLPFVRILRDVVRYEMFQIPGSTAQLIGEGDDSLRAEYLSRFADHEGQVFLRRFWTKHHGHATAVIQGSILTSLRNSERLAAAWRYLNPSGDFKAFSAALEQYLEEATPAPQRLQALYERFAPGRWDLADQGYLARVHPLELWLAAWLTAHPQGKYEDAVRDSAEERQEVYRWLFRTRARDAQDSRIRLMLEIEAFLEIHRRWERQGYPFDSLVPSLATALGSSGDRPAALAELMGIIVNDGIRLPVMRLEQLHFARRTPYETVFERQTGRSERVMRREVAAALREALGEVVEGGTARRLAGSFTTPDGKVLPVGGKTGTGDNRIYNIGAGGTRSGGVAQNRTATLVFYLGERHFGTLTAWVTGPEASRFSFTSGLPTQILKSMAPLLSPWLDPARPGDCATPVADYPPRATPNALPAP